MKNIITLLSISLLAMAPGCMTGPDGKRQIDPVVLESVAHDAALLGTQITLQTNPQYRPAFDQARLALALIVATHSGSPADLQLALANLPVKELQGTNGAVAVRGATLVISLARAELTRLDKQQIGSLYVQPIARGLLAGMNEALGVPATTAK